MAQGTLPGDGNLVFLSDGRSNEGGPYTDEVASLQGLGVNLKAFGAGTGASLTHLQAIDPGAQIFTSTDELLAVFSGLSSGSVVYLEPGLAGWTIYLDMNNNGILDLNEPTAVTANDNPGTPEDETGTYALAGLEADTYTVAEESPSAWEQTFPRIATFDTSGQYSLNLGYGPAAVETADVDGDGDADLMVLHANPAPTFGASVSILLNNGQGSFTSQSSYTVTGVGRPGGLSSDDLDGDGDIDLAVWDDSPSGGAGTDAVFILLNQGNGSFDASGQSSVGLGYGPTAVETADVDGNGDVDLVTLRRDPSPVFGASVSILSNNGQGAFSPQSSYTVTGLQVPGGLSSDDLDGDGDIDLAVWDDSPSGGAGTDAVFILRNNLGSHLVTVTPGAAVDGVDFGNRLTEVDHFPDVRKELVLQLPGGGTETVKLSGTATMHVYFPGQEGGASDSDGDGLDQVSTELVQLQLSGTSAELGAIQIRLDQTRPTVGEIEEQVNNTPGTLDLPPFVATGLADSFFDVFVEIEANGQILHTAEPEPLHAVISHKPSAVGESYVTPIGMTPIPVLDAAGQPTGVFIVSEQVTPNPRRLTVDVLDGYGVSSPNDPTTAYLDIVFDVPAGIEEYLAAYNVVASLSPTGQGVTFSGAVEAPNAVFPGQTPQVFGNTGDQIQVADNLPQIGQENRIVDQAGLLRLTFDVAAGTQGDFLIDLPMVRLFRGNGSAIVGFLVDTGVLHILPSLPKVSKVSIGSTEWADTFPCKDGYVMPTEESQLLSLPWINLNQINIQFTEDVTVHQDDLTLIGINVPSYTFTAFAYDAVEHQATWTLADAIGPDRLQLTLPDTVTGIGGVPLDGEWMDASSTFDSGNDIPGGNFVFSVNVLPGDVNQDGFVFGNDVILVRNRQFQFPGSPDYACIYDVDGSGSIFGNDVIFVRNRQFTTLPTAPAMLPLLAAVSPSGGTSSAAPTTGATSAVGVTAATVTPTTMTAAAAMTFPMDRMELPHQPARLMDLPSEEAANGDMGSRTSNVAAFGDHDQTVTVRNRTAKARSVSVGPEELLDSSFISLTEWIDRI